MYEALVFGVLLSVVKEILGHGMMIDPPNRSSLWRTHSGAPINYNDNQNFCGGFYAQWYLFDGKCGVCGDSYGSSHPQDNENMGKYGKGIIAERYQSGEVIDIHVLLTANHKGFFKYSLCILEDVNNPENGEDCFVDLPLSDGSYEFHVSKDDRLVNNQIKLPDGLTCERCVLRWQYTTGNNWGNCEDGTSGLGCGPQETFRTCSDIQIV